MRVHSRLAAFALGVVFLAVVIGLFIGGWFIGVIVASRVDRATSALVNAALALTPMAVVLFKGERNSIVLSLAALALLLVVMTATLTIHAEAWTRSDWPVGSGARLLILLSALFWPVLAIGALALTVSRQTGQRLTRAASLAGTVVLVGLNVSLVWFLMSSLADTLPMWLLVVGIVSIGVLLQFVLESEIALLMARRASVAVPSLTSKVNAEVGALTKIPVAGPIVVDRVEEMAAEIRWRLLGRPVLILSAAIARLDPLALKAVIAHEYAHAALGHLRMRLWIAMGSAFALVAVATLGQVVLFGDTHRPLGAALVLVLALVGQRLVLNAFVRRQEQEADQFAAAVAGTDAMRAALHLTAVGPVIPSGFSIWTTHYSPEERQRALDHVP